MGIRGIDMYVCIFGTYVKGLIKVFTGSKTKVTFLYVCIFGTNVKVIIFLSASYNKEVLL